MSYESKLALYNRMLSTRDELKPEFTLQAGFEIQKRLLLMEEFRTATRIGLFAPYGNEVRTDGLFLEGDRQRKEFYYPAADAASGGVAYFRVAMLEELKPTVDGWRVPSVKQSKLRDINTLNVLVVPGVAFDLHGSRMGFGRNFYEENLVKFRGTRIALAYDFQVVSELPPAVRGRKVDWIVTEKRIIKSV